MSDLIDRKDLGAAIDNWLAIDRYYHPYSKQKTIPVSELVDIIKLLPSAQPEQREEAIIDPVDLVRNLADRIGIHQLYAIAWDLRGEPAQRTGRWIDGKVKHIKNGELRNVRECSECGSSYFVYDYYNSVDEIPKFCPNCGARMEEQE